MPANSNTEATVIREYRFEAICLLLLVRTITNEGVLPTEP
jgi:hypothetical protein